MEQAENNNHTDCTWALINRYLEQQRDRVQSAITHARLLMGAAVVVIVLLLSASIIKPLVNYADKSEKPHELEPALLAVVISSSFAVCVVLIFALSRLFIAFRISMLEGLADKVKAVKKACSESHINVPSSTEIILENFERDARSY